MKKIFLMLVFLFVSFISMAQMKKIVINTSHVEYGSIIHDIPVLDGDKIPERLEIIIKNDKLIINGGGVYQFRNSVRFANDNATTIFDIYDDFGIVSVKLDKANCIISFLYEDGANNMRFTTYYIQSIVYKKK